MQLVIKKIQECKKINKFLDDICEKYFISHAPSNRYYSGWKFSDNYPNCIVLHYAYYDWRDQYQSGDEIIPMDVLVEFSKRINK